MRVSKQELVSALAKELKPILHKPEWADFVKTGMHKERPPVDADWWYMRAGSILLKIHRLGPIGVSKLRTKYGGRKNRGVRPEKFYKGSGSIIRKLLQHLESVGLLKQETKGVHKGRVLTPKAVSLIAQTTKKIDKARPMPKLKQMPKAEIKEEKPKPEKKAKEKKEEAKEHDKPEVKK
ncbi:30S ribosomal protein S19e [Candidatus Woesearchaeota archaeon]|nr:30S ribosomal protein S19e [Candidatus Woesearchaeota archaeon]